MEAPESVVIALKNIRPTFRLVWNHKGRVVGERSYDVNGNPRELTYEPRWELWDTDVFGAPYKVMTLEDQYKGSFLPADQQFVDFVNLINPARYEGDLSKLSQALVDDKNAYIEKVNEQDFARLQESLAEYFTSALT